MDKGDGEKTADDGIVAEDLTLLVEHIELTSPHRLPEAHDWELATPATDLDEAPILFDDHERESAEAHRGSIVSPAPRSKAAQRKDATKRTEANEPVHSLRTLLADHSAWEEVTFQDPAQAPISYAHPAQAI